jgi:hypothetical protein
MTMAMQRVSSQKRLPGKGGTVAPGTSGGKGGLGERTVSLPSLFPSTGAGQRGYPPLSDKPALKRSPSEVMLERREYGPLHGRDGLPHKPQITAFLDIAQFSNHAESKVPVDQTLFSVHPPVVTFKDFEGLQTYEATVTLRNQDHVARRLKVHPPDSPFFELAPGRRSAGANKRSQAGSGSGDKVAPGMEVTYVIRFKPDARIDYSYDLVFITEREKFSVPIRASGGSALLDFPDVIDFGDECVVGHKSERTVLVRNVGDRSTKFVLRTNPPFSIVAPDSYLAEGASCQVSVYFAPERSERYENELHLKYGELEACTTLRGAATNVEVSLSHSQLLVEDTYVGLETKGVVTIRNDSDVPVDFSWRLFPSDAEEHQHRQALHTHLKKEERDEMLYLQQAQLSEDESDDSGSDGERLRARREGKVTSGLSRKYGNIRKAVQEDPMLFRDTIFAIEPLVGRVWSHSEMSCACAFSPKDALVYSCTAFLSCAGQEERASLQLRGLGIGPKAAFSYDELDVGNVFVESAHRYEVQLLNQGDIEVDFRLNQKESQLGSSRFKFEPSSGQIAVGGQCEIIVDFNPNELGPFHEIFEWTLKGSATSVTLAFKGVSIKPTFEFDADKINFGTVSFGFLNSRVLTLTNTSEVPCIYTLRIPGDDAPPKNEFDVIPAKGTLLPSCSQRIQVDFISCAEKKYDLKLSVDLEGVCKELLWIPIIAQCAVPQVAFEPHGCLDYGDVFIRYPFHQSLYVHNTSNLPAKFEVLPQEDKSQAEFEPDQWTGSVPPCASHVITVTLTAHCPGPLRIPMYVKIHGRPVPFPLVLIATSVGPRVVVDPQTVDWGNVKCLEPVTRHVRLTNNSCIDASVRAFMNDRRSLWTIHPKIIHLSPQETLQLALTLRIDEIGNAQDIMNLVVNEGNDLSVQVRGKGVDTPVKCDHPLDLIDFSTLFTTQTESRDIVIKNHGTQARRITWYKDKDKKDKKDKKDAQPTKQDPSLGAPVFRVEPENVTLEPKTAYRFTFLAMSTNPGIVEETLICQETVVDKGGGVGKPIFKPRFKAVFVAPHLKLSTQEIKFKFMYDKDTPIHNLTESVSLENTGPLEVRFRIEVQPPFSVDIEEGSIASNSVQVLQVDFDPSYKTDRKNGKIQQRLTIQYDEHPSINTVDLIGEVVFPNLKIDIEKLDFGTILNETSKKLEIRMTNPTALTVPYTWCFAATGKQADESSNPRTPAVMPASPNLEVKTSAPPGGAGASGNVLGGMGMSPGSTTTDLALAEPDVNQIFDILPIFGKLEPGETSVARFTYYGMKDKSWKATAICMTDGGPEYEVNLRGNAAPCIYNLDKHDLDFSNIPFTEVAEQEVILWNQGKVPASFNFNLVNISRPDANVVEVSPGSGTIKPEDRQRVIVRFRAGIPDQVEETVLVEVAHFEPAKLTVRGKGTFPGIVLRGIPRANQEEHALALEAAARRMMHSATSSAVGSQDYTAMADGPGGTSPAFHKTASMTRSVTGSVDAADGKPRRSMASSMFEGNDDPSPRSAAPTEMTGSMTGKGKAAEREKRAEEKARELADLEMEFEVDRHYLCEVLLNNALASQSASSGWGDKDPRSPGLRSTKSGTFSTSFGATGKKSAPKRDKGSDGQTQTFTAGYYVCDFGHIALGQTSKKQIAVHNCCSETVVVTIDKKLLRENGFLVEPEHVRPLPPGKMQMLQVTATRSKEEDEKNIQLEWNLPVRGGPNYKIQLIADFVLPDLIMSSDFIDFGRILLGQRRRATLEFRNEKLVPVEWTFLEQKDVYGKRKEEHILFDMTPSSGTLLPGERKHVVVSFSPRTAGQFSSALPLRIKDNQRRKQINVIGRGDILRMEVRPSATYALGPIMPKRDGDKKEFTLYNPTDYAIEVYSTEFDKRYIQEQALLRDYDEYVSNVAELSVRQPGDGIWKPVASRVAALRRERAEEEARSRGEEPENDGGAAAIEAAAMDETEELVYDPLSYPYRVPQADRLNAILLGPAKSGMSTLAERLTGEDLRKVLVVDEAVEWALRDPRFLRSDRKAKKIAGNIRSGGPPSVEDFAHLLRRRVELADCNAGVIIDGYSSKYLEPAQVVEMVMLAFRSEKTAILSVQLPPAGDGVTSAAAAAPKGGDAEPPPPSAAGAVLMKHYEALQAALVPYSEELRTTKLPELEEAQTAAEELLASLSAALVPPPDVGDAGVGAGAGAGGGEAEVLEAEVKPWAPDPEAVAAKEQAEKSLAAAVAAVKATQAELARCEASIGWAPPRPPGEEEVAEDPKKKDGKAAPKAKAAPVSDEPPKPVADPAIELLAVEYNRQRALAMSAVERWNAQAKQEEEDKQREADRKMKRARKAAAAKEAAKKAQSRTGLASSKKAKEEVVEEAPPAEFEPNLDDWLPPFAMQDLPLVSPPLDTLIEAGRTGLPLSLIPKEVPLPPMATVQSVSPPAERPEVKPPANFTILTPVPLSELSRTPSKEINQDTTGDGDAAQVEAVQEKLVSDQTRWIIEPQSEQRLLVNFNSEECNSYSATLRFEVVGDIASGLVPINVSGIAALPGISSDPRVIFPRCKRRRPPDGCGYASKAFVVPLGIYDYGPLLAGRDPESRQRPVEDGADPAGGAEGAPAGAGAAQPESLEAPRTGAPGADAKSALVSSFVMRHAENIKIYNDSLFQANVRIGLASSGGDFASALGGEEAAAAPAAAVPAGGQHSSPFIIEPETLSLGKGEQAEVKVWCFPHEAKVYEDRLVALIEHNPAPVSFGLSALGMVPSVSLHPEKVDFGRLMMNELRDQRIRLKNDSALPAKWQLVCTEAKVIDPAEDKKAKGEAPKKESAKKAEEDVEEAVQIPEEFTVEPREGTLAAGEEREVRVSFRAAKPAVLDFDLRLDAKDSEGFKSWNQAGHVAVHAETFAVDAAVEPDPREAILDFGTVLVNKKPERKFDIVNRGRFPIRYELAVRGRMLRELLQLDKPKGKLAPKGEPGDRITITVTCAPTRDLEVYNERDGIMLQIFDAESEMAVSHGIPPLRVGVKAVYNDFQVTPPRGLNFGPVEKGETQNRSFTIRNTGTFPFDWSLFDYADPPTMEDGRPPNPPASIKVGPFTVKPTSGTLQPDEPVQVEVVFEAIGDRDYDSKIAMWVDGVNASEVADLGNGHPGATATGNIAGCAAYILSGQSCIPGINTMDLQTIFEEQFFAWTLEDAVAIAGKPDVRVFCESSQVFHFGPVLAHGTPGSVSLPSSPTAAGGGGAAEPGSTGVTERLRLTNPKAIPCKVRLAVAPKDDNAGGGKAGKGKAESAELPFAVEPSEVVIPARKSKQIEVSFKPTRLAGFDGILSAEVVGGSDPRTNFLSFELRGDGAVPSVSIQGPRLFGDEGGELQMGKLAVGRSHEVRMALRNNGLLPATVRVDSKASEHFTVACPGSVSLSTGEQRTFQVRFHPRAAGQMKTELNIRTVGNPFEDYSGPRALKLAGEGYSDAVCWDLTEVRRPGGAAAAAEEPSQAAAPPSPDDLQLGEVALGSEARVAFQLTNGSAEPLRFQLPEEMPAPFFGQLKAEPRAGFVEPSSRQPITLTFLPTQKLEADKVAILCKVVNIAYDGPPQPSPGDGSEPPERPYHELDQAKDVPLQVSATADTRIIECDVTEIKFAPTRMFCTKLFKLVLKNPSAIAAPFEWRVQGKHASAFSVSPLSGAVPAAGEQKVEVRFAPVEVEPFDCMLHCVVPSLDGSGTETALKMPLSGSAVRPFCHIELPPCDYRSRRQSNTPLDPRIHVAELVSLGTHVKNTKRFYVHNPTAESIDFVWVYDDTTSGGGRPGSADDETFRCLTKKGNILPSKKFEMIFEYAPNTIETKESFWKFLLLGPKVEEPFLIVGSVNEPRVGMDRPFINFGERLLDGTVSETVRLVNKEHIPFSFTIDPFSFQLEGRPQAVSVSPMNGVVGPDSFIDVEVTFKPHEEGQMNFNIICKVKRKKEPVILNVKGIGYKIHSQLSIEDPGGSRSVNAGVTEMLDFGMLQVHEKRTVKMFLKNNSKRNFNYQVQARMGPRRRPMALSEIEKPPYLAISPMQGVAAAGEEPTSIELTYEPKNVHALDGLVLQISIPVGPKEDMYTLALTGGAKKSKVEFSFLDHDFGPCFCAQGGDTMAGEPFATSAAQGHEVIDLVCTNRDDTDCLVATTFERQPWLDVQLNSTMIEAGGSVRVPIVFTPRKETRYSERVEFVVNDYTRTFVRIDGVGCPLRLELTELEMQNVDFGVTTGGEPLSRQVRLVNRSPRPVTFQLGDNGELLEHSVTWTPAQPTTLRPRETRDVELRFAPTHRVAPFRLPLMARCDHGVELKLLQIAGTCHAMEMRLSEHSIFFGDVVVGSQAVRVLRLHNFGDIGAKFRFEVPAKYGKIFIVSPAEGYVRPQEDIQLSVSFSPTQEAAQRFRQAERSKASRGASPSPAAGGKGTAAPAADAKGGLDVSIHTRDIRCILDGHPPLTLEASGRVVTQVGDTKTLEFSTAVRSQKSMSITIQNPQNVMWTLKPQLVMVEPTGVNYFSCKPEITVPAGKSVDIEVVYLPLTMTGMLTEPPLSPTSATGKTPQSPSSPMGRSLRCEKHRGTFFVGTPDGNAIRYNLEGTALAPKEDGATEARVPYKKQHIQSVPMKNWLHERQRFDVKLELLDPPPNSQEAQSIVMQGVGTLDLPPGIERDYKFSIYAYHVPKGKAEVRVTFTSQSTGEFKVMRLALVFYKLPFLNTIEVEAACRQVARHKIAVTNPLNQSVRLQGISKNPYIKFSPDAMEVPAKSEKTVELLFRPLEEGQDETKEEEVMLTSPELGAYPYKVSWKATPAGLERAVVLKAPLGGSAVENFKFMHFAETPVTYSAKIEPLGDFVLESAEAKAPAATGGEPAPMELRVRFQPSSLGECRAMLTVTGAKGGEYKAMLMGYAQPPQPQGPITILGKKEGLVNFRNPFNKPTDFTLQVDNVCFTVPQRLQRIDPNQAVDIKVSFKSDRVQNGRLIISCDKVSTPWIFFLKGEL